ncbi:MAG: hypothetical protein H6718_22160 [Polyangiaceae bacterium]|nr:hypothetical protein [Polyangiaceae bacterium]
MNSIRISLLSLGLFAFACGGGHPPPHGPHGGKPPEEAFKACDGKAAEADCSMAGPDGESHLGKCKAPPPDAKDTRLMCAPEGGHGPEHHGPPPQK